MRHFRLTLIPAAALGVALLAQPAAARSPHDHQGRHSHFTAPYGHEMREDRWERNDLRREMRRDYREERREDRWERREDGLHDRGRGRR